MKLKVCGITTIEQAMQLQQAAVDYAGLIFYDGSKRYAHEKLKAVAPEIKKLVIKKVGVFVNADMGFLKSCIQGFGLNLVQLHGDESSEYCEEVRRNAEVIKVFRINNNSYDIDKKIEPFQNSCDYFLFDADTADYGGSGRRFDWKILANSKINKPFFLSGGISLDDTAILQHFVHPFFFAVDVNSRFETAPGLKDMTRVSAFATELKYIAWIK